MAEINCVCRYGVNSPLMRQDIKIKRLSAAQSANEGSVKSVANREQVPAIHSQTRCPVVDVLNLHFSD